VRVEVLNAVNMKITVFWDMTPCSLVKKKVTPFCMKLIPPIFEVYQDGGSTFLRNVAGAFYLED
jgi:hypothetical protein